jgi:hypothetical protein
MWPSHHQKCAVKNSTHVKLVAMGSESPEFGHIYQFGVFSAHQLGLTDQQPTPNNCLIWLVLTSVLVPCWSLLVSAEF